jgi:hypothetical protein
MTNLYGTQLHERQKLQLECRFHELWVVGGRITHPQPIQEINGFVFPFALSYMSIDKRGNGCSGMVTEEIETLKLKGVYITFNCQGKLIRCGISPDLVQTLKHFTPWTNECYHSYQIADIHTTEPDMRQYKQHLKRLKHVSFL